MRSLTAESLASKSKRAFRDETGQRSNDSGGKLSSVDIVPLAQPPPRRLFRSALSLNQKRLITPFTGHLREGIYLAIKTEEQSVSVYREISRSDCECRSAQPTIHTTRFVVRKMRPFSSILTCKAAWRMRTILPRCIIKRRTFLHSPMANRIIT